ncbi:hypothetical protein R1sor_011009 [Riccia sorocarpa]|uniref:Tetratricopeptide repeat protein 21B n=1 Tax=Riccia sorocarpa TaxID=122646 RepID=A0ABD3HZP7_9MARC
MADEVQATILYYTRMGYGQHIHSFCSKLLQKRPKDPVLLFWHAFGLILEGSYADALRELQAISEKREVEVAVVAAMLHAHRLCAVVDREEIELLEQRLQVTEKCSSEKALFLAATLYLCLGETSNIKKVREMTTRILQIQQSYAPYECLSGWIGLRLEGVGKKSSTSTSRKHGPDTTDASLKIFNAVLDRGNCIEALLGRAQFFELKDDFEKAIDDLNQVIVLYPWYLPALCEKGRLAVILQDWVLAHETAQLIIQKDPSNIEGLHLCVHVMLCTGNEVESVDHLLDKLLKVIEEREARNGNLCLQVASSLARVAGRWRPSMLVKTLTLVKRSERLLMKQAEVYLEIADQHFLLADYKAALQNYRLASQLDELSMEPIYGSVQCLLLLDEIEEAGQQLEFLAEISVSMGKSASLCWLKAQMVWIMEQDYCRCRDLLLETVAIQSKIMTKRKDYEFYTQLNPDRILSVANLFSVLSKHECKGLQVDRVFCLQQSVALLELVLDSIPGFFYGHLMLAEVLIQLEELDSAHCTLQTALGLDPTSAAAQLLLSQVQVQLGKYDTAKQSLEKALSDSFMVRDSVKYHVLLAQILLEAQDNDEALKVLESAVLLPGMKQGYAEPYKAYYASFVPNTVGETSDYERVLIYLLLAEVHMRFGHIPEATKIIQDAMNLFRGTPEEARVVISNSNLALRRNDVSAALAMLKQVPAENRHFIQAKVAMADTYLIHWHDKIMYASCYRELTELFPSARTFLMLGDAYMKTHELGNAVQAYESATKASPKDADVAARVGKALLASHNYVKALEHYNATMQDVEEGTSKLVLYLDLAGNAFTGEQARSTILSKYLPYYKVMKNARNLQSRLLSASYKQEEDMIKEQNLIAADIYYQFAKECEVRKDLDKAVTLLHEALKCNPEHYASTLLLANIHLSSGDTSECEQKCALLLKHDPFNTEAGDILVRLILHKELYESAIVYFKRNLERDPGHYFSLAQLIRLLRCAGQIDEAQQYVQAAEKACPASLTRAGLYYCKGILSRYLNNPHEAVQMLNRAHSDPEWVKPAIYLLVEIYLNIDNEITWEEANVEGTTPINEEGIKAAWKLLGENRLLDGQSLNQLVLECYATMATKQRADIEFALGRLTESASKDEPKVSVLLAIATALTLLKQTSKAKNQLRILERMTYKWENGEDFERAWLMLADILMQAGKTDAADELCRRCLKYNRDCARAWEYLGIMMEQGHSYGEAVVYFETAWNCQRGGSPSVGYRLAFTFLKEKRYIEAITVCHKVLKKFPSFPRVKKEILDKARLCLRP